MIYNLITTGSSDIKNKKNIFYLGNWCHNFKKKNQMTLKNLKLTNIIGQTKKNLVKIIKRSQN